MQLKKTILFCTILAGSLQASAQYKKASFFNKSGRIYEIGFGYYNGTNEIKGRPAYFMSFGRENGDKSVHHWFDISLLFPARYSVKVESNMLNVPEATISGKTALAYSIRYNLAFFIGGRGNEDKKVFPYIKAAIGYIGQGIPGQEYDIEPSNANPLRTPSYNDNALIFGGGLGVKYQLNQRTGIRLGADYDALVGTDDTPYSFPLLQSQPSVSLAVRFIMVRD